MNRIWYAPASNAAWVSPPGGRFISCASTHSSARRQRTVPEHEIHHEAAVRRIRQQAVGKVAGRLQRARMKIASRREAMPVSMEESVEGCGKGCDAFAAFTVIPKMLVLHFPKRAICAM